MKRKVFYLFGVAAIGAAIAFNANFGLRVESLSDIALANIEALANDETSEADCSDGIPRVLCRIWTVTYNFTLDEWSSTTGGEYKCIIGG